MLYSDEMMTLIIIFKVYISVSALNHRTVHGGITLTIDFRIYYNIVYSKINALTYKSISKK